MPSAGRLLWGLAVQARSMHTSACGVCGTRTPSALPRTPNPLTDMQHVSLRARDGAVGPGPAARAGAAERVCTLVHVHASCNQPVWATLKRLPGDSRTLRSRLPPPVLPTCSLRYGGVVEPFFRQRARLASQPVPTPLSGPLCHLRRRSCLPAFPLCPPAHRPLPPPSAVLTRWRTGRR